MRRVYGVLMAILVFALAVVIVHAPDRKSEALDVYKKKYDSLHALYLSSELRELKLLDSIARINGRIEYVKQQIVIEEKKHTKIKRRYEKRIKELESYTGYMLDTLFSNRYKEPGHVKDTVVESPVNSERPDSIRLNDSREQTFGDHLGPKEPTTDGHGDQECASNQSPWRERDPGQVVKIRNRYPENRISRCTALA
jgi:hypothetical protein